MLHKRWNSIVLSHGMLLVTAKIHPVDSMPAALNSNSDIIASTSPVSGFPSRLLNDDEP